jgi:hypothetical protein
MNMLSIASTTPSLGSTAQIPAVQFGEYDSKEALEGIVAFSLRRIAWTSLRRPAWEIARPQRSERYEASLQR